MIAKDETVLLSVDERVQTSCFYCNLSRNDSSLTTSVNWPVIFYNIGEWLKSNQSGPDRINVKLGDKIYFKPAPLMRDLVVLAPGGEQQLYQLGDEKLMLFFSEPGVYKLKNGKDEYKLSVNVMNSMESSLLANSFKFIKKSQSYDELKMSYYNLSYIFILLALGLLIFHQYLIRRRVK